ncbi:MAG: TIM barrel protein [Clostridiales Family XIII bacterium]|jgi:hydroxypyruvate isomerase|nr:TIM barrel protein [Clostridiales Family XIII bacterium]
MKLQKSVCIDALYTELPFIERFAAAQADGFDYIEFWGHDDKDIDAIERLVNEKHIKISGFNGDADLNLIDPNQQKEYLEYLKKSLSIAQRIGSKSVTIHSNGLGDGGIVLNSYRELSTTLKTAAMYDTLLQCAQLAEQTGININLEPLNIISDHIGNFLNYTSDAADLTRLIGSDKLKILYDVYHMQLNEGNIAGNIDANVDQFGHIHIADTPGRHEPGTGEINYAFVFDYLENAGYTGLIGYELFPLTDTKTAVEAIMSY